MDKKKQLQKKKIEHKSENEILREKKGYINIRPEEKRFTIREDETTISQSKLQPKKLKNSTTKNPK